VLSAVRAKEKTTLNKDKLNKLEDLLYEYQDYLREEAEIEAIDIDEYTDEAIKTLLIDIRVSKNSLIVRGDN